MSVATTRKSFLVTVYAVVVDLAVFVFVFFVFVVVFMELDDIIELDDIMGGLEG